jgi:hypothetical protein
MEPKPGPTSPTRQGEEKKERKNKYGYREEGREKKNKMLECH